MNKADVIDFLHWKSTIQELRASSARAECLRERKERVRQALLSEASRLADRPYIEDAVYHWKYVDEAVTLDFMFPDIPFAVLVSDAYSPYNVLPEPMARKLWEEALASNSATALACYRADIPLLIVGPNDPVDEKSILLQVDKILDRKRGE